MAENTYRVFSTMHHQANIAAYRERYRKLNDQLEELVNQINVLLADDSVVCLVEGKRDIRALHRAGVKGNNAKFVSISGKRVHEVLDNLKLQKVDKVILLTDLDREGKAIAARIREYATNHEIKILDKPRRMLRRFDQRIYAIEDIFGLCKRLEALKLL